MTNPTAPTPTIKDTRGVELAVGDWVVCYRNSLGMRSGEVTEIRTHVKVRYLTHSRFDTEAWFDPKHYVIKTNGFPMSAKQAVINSDES